MDSSEPTQSAPPSPTPAEPAIVWVKPLTTLFIFAVALVCVIAFFEAVATVLLGFLAATIVACALDPLVRRIPLPRGISAAIIGLGFIAVVVILLVGLSIPLTHPIQDELNEWPATKEKIDRNLERWGDQLSMKAPLTVDALMRNMSEFFAGSRAPHFFSQSADVLLSIVIWLIFVFIGSIFILSDPFEHLLKPALQWVSPHRRLRVQVMLESLAPRLRRWVIGTMTSMFIVFGASLIGFTASGLKFALPLAALAGLFEIVPTAGPAMAMLIALLFAATQDMTAVFGVMITYAVVQSIEAYVVLPMIMRGAVKVHPAVTLFTVVFWGKIFGVPGLMLAIPINLTISALVDHLYIRPRDGELLTPLPALPAESTPAKM